MDYDFTPTFDELNDFLDGMIDIAEDMFIQIKNREQIDFGRFCLNTIDELASLKKGAAALQDRMDRIREELALDSGFAKSFKSILDPSFVPGSREAKRPLNRSAKKRWLEELFA